MYRVFDPNRPRRNYNCRIRESIVGGVRQLSLDNRFLHISVLPGKGTDIVEFLYKPLDMDFMYHSWMGIRPSGGDFFDPYPGGWQELFPSVGAGGECGGAKLPLHGEVHALPWDVRIEKDAEEEIIVKFSVRTVRTPYLLEKWLTLRADEPALYIRERATNEGRVPLRFSWGHHPALGPAFLDENCTIEIPGDSLRLHPYPGTRLQADGEYTWPRALLDDGTPIDLSRVLPPENRCLTEFGITGLTAGEVEVINHSHRLAFGLRWNPEQLPVLWFWQPNCGNENQPSYGRDYALGVEPWTNLPGEPLAVPIAPGESKELELTAYARAF